MKMSRQQQAGVVIIMVLWTTVVLTIMVTVLASQVRLSATTAWHHQLGSEQLMARESALNLAQMELMLSQMPASVDQVLEIGEDGLVRNPLYRFNGQALVLAYPAPDDMVVRIVNHAGKINLNRISLFNMRQIIEGRLGGQDVADATEVDELLAAWIDWTDVNDLVTPGGAESEYYLGLDPPYRPRNTPELDSVDELLLIRGFDTLFAGMDLEAAFTIYGNQQQVNFNLATPEALALLPGLDAAAIETILEVRQLRDLRGAADLAELLDAEQLAPLLHWTGDNVSTFHTIHVHPRPASEEADLPVRAYRQIVDARNADQRPRVLLVYP